MLFYCLFFLYALIPFSTATSAVNPAYGEISYEDAKRLAILMEVNETFVEILLKTGEGTPFMEELQGLKKSIDALFDAFYQDKVLKHVCGELDNIPDVIHRMLMTYRCDTANPWALHTKYESLDHELLDIPDFKYLDIKKKKESRELLLERFNEDKVRFEVTVENGPVHKRERLEPVLRKFNDTVALERFKSMTGRQDLNSMYEIRRHYDVWQTNCQPPSKNSFLGIKYSCVLASTLTFTPKKHP